MCWCPPMSMSDMRYEMTNHHATISVAFSSPIHRPLTFICIISTVLSLPVRAFMHRAATVAARRHTHTFPHSLISHVASRPTRRSFAIMSTETSGGNDNIRYVDAGANLLDSMYQGTYHDKLRHEPDLDIVLRRAFSKGVDKVISLAGTIKESEELMKLIDDLDGESDDTGCVQVFGTVGVHPTRCAEVFADKGEGGDWTPKTEREQNDLVQQLIGLAIRGKESNNVVAIGECGLDYARLHFCPKGIQKLGLRAQLQVARETELPMYLHNRESGDDLFEILSEYRDALEGAGELRGIVHSFDEGIEVAGRFLSLGLYIGINGCSLKTPENIEVVRQLPLDRLILETDCPWCDIRPTHAGSGHVLTTFPTKKDKQYTREYGLDDFCVKNRTEPCHVAQVAEVVAGIQGKDVREVVDASCRNVHGLFGKLDKRGASR